MAYKKILLVDDDEDDRLLFLDAVSEINSNWKCEIATDGVEALVSLRTQAPLPDIVFLDLNMGRMNGFECLHEIKKDHNFRNIPIVVFTTSKIQAERERSLQMGAKYFFSKPGDFAVLKTELDKILKVELS